MDIFSWYILRESLPSFPLLACVKDVYRFLSEAHCSNIHLKFLLQTNDSYTLIMFLIISSDDIETNPGSKNNIKMSFCCWNLNGIAAHNISKVSLLQAMATTHDYDIMSWLETVLLLRLTRLMIN